MIWDAGEPKSLGSDKFKRDRLVIGRIGVFVFRRGPEPVPPVDPPILATSHSELGRIFIKQVRTINGT
jgi:hypothetical protein